MHRGGVAFPLKMSWESTWIGAFQKQNKCSSLVSLQGPELSQASIILCCSERFFSEAVAPSLPDASLWRD